jgi:hypothetical protein
MGRKCLKTGKVAFLTHSKAQHLRKTPGIDDLHLGTNAWQTLLQNVSKLVCEKLARTDT